MTRTEWLGRRAAGGGEGKPGSRTLPAAPPGSTGPGRRFQAQAMHPPRGASRGGPSRGAARPHRKAWLLLPRWPWVPQTGPRPHAASREETSHRGTRGTSQPAPGSQGCTQPLSIPTECHQGCGSHLSTCMETSDYACHSPRHSVKGHRHSRKQPPCRHGGVRADGQAGWARGCHQRVPAQERSPGVPRGTR